MKNVDNVNNFENVRKINEKFGNKLLVS